MRVDGELEVAQVGAICMLLVNRIPEMPRISIASILNTTNKKIYLGYVNEDDVGEFRNNSQIVLVDLNSEYRQLDLSLQVKYYSGWSDDNFFKIVQLKWVLLERVMKLGLPYVIYSDLDVVWNLDAYQEIENCFNSRVDISVLIQSFSRSLTEPKLCMGFVAFRNDENSNSFIEKGAIRHRAELLCNSRIGDDDIATFLYHDLDYPKWLCELPQTTFPVGVTFDLFRSKSTFPGLVAQEPFIFHANFVVGLSNKVILMKMFLSKKDRRKLDVRITYYERMIIVIKRIKFHFLKFLGV